MAPRSALERGEAEAIKDPSRDSSAPAHKTSRLQDRVEQLERELSNARQQAEQLRDDCARATSALEEERAKSRAAIDAAAEEADVAHEAADTAQDEVTQWQRRCEALERELPQRAEEMAVARTRAYQLDLEKAHACIATLRAARWQPQSAEIARLAELAGAGASGDAAELAAEARRMDEQTSARVVAEAWLLTSELRMTEEALQHSSAAAIMLGSKAEELLMRLTERTAVEAQRTTAELISASVRQQPAMSQPQPASADAALAASAMRQHAHGLKQIYGGSSTSTPPLAGSMPRLSGSGGGSGGSKARMPSPQLPTVKSVPKLVPREYGVPGRKSY